MAKKRAARQAESRAANTAANPPRPKRAEAETPRAVTPSRPAKKRAAAVPQSEPTRSSEPQRSVASSRPSERPGRPQRNRVAIAVILAVGLLLGFWLLFRLPGTLSHGQH